MVNSIKTDTVKLRFAIIHTEPGPLVVQEQEVLTAYFSRKKKLRRATNDRRMFLEFQLINAI